MVEGYEKSIKKGNEDKVNILRNVQQLNPSIWEKEKEFKEV